MNNRHTQGSPFSRNSLPAVTAVAIAFASAAFGACSSPFDSCEAHRNCPRGGEGGLDGEGGDNSTVGSGGTDSNTAGTLSAGAAPTGGSGGHASEPVGGAGGSPLDIGGAGAAPEVGGGGAEDAGIPSNPGCSQDVNCDDGLFCNGAERCVSGKCEAGTNPCINPDEQNCEVTCAEGADAAHCNVQGQDKDGDTARSNACAQNPGTDCDDSSATVSPSAKEVCDGIDNDCDAKADFADGLQLSGNNELFAHSQLVVSAPVVAWSPLTKTYGTVVVGGPTGSPSDSYAVYFQTFDQGGGTHLDWRRATPEDDGARNPTITWAGDRFGFAYVDYLNSVIVRQVTADGALSGVPWPVASGASTSYLTPKLARLAAGNWGLVYTECSRGCGVSALSISASGGPGTTFSVSQADSGALVASGDRFVMIYDKDSGGAKAEFRDATLAEGTSLSISGTVPVLGAGPDGSFAIVTQASNSKPTVTVFDSTGTPVCSAVAFGDTSFIPNAVVGTVNGWLVVSRAAVRVQHIFSDCKLGPLLGLGVTGVPEVYVSGGDEGYAVVWEDGALGPMRRLFGPKLCN